MGICIVFHYYRVLSIKRRSWDIGQAAITVCLGYLTVTVSNKATHAFRALTQPVSIAP